MAEVRRCAFCRRAGLNREDAIAKWISKELAATRGHGVLALDLQGGVIKRPLRRAKLLDAVVKAACTECNNGWMSDLEGAVKPILSPLLHGHRRNLSMNEQRVMAAWSMKTAAMLEHLVGPAPHRRYLRWLYQKKEPHPDVKVYLAGYVGSPAAQSTVRDILVTGKGRSDEACVRVVTFLYLALCSSRGDASP